MLDSYFIKHLALLLILCGYRPYISAQTCLDDYFTAEYKGSENFSLIKSISTVSNELVCTGKITYTRNGLVSSNGWIAKLNQNGIVLWSKQFQVPGFNYTVLNDIVEGADGMYYAVGEATDTVGGSNLPVVVGLFMRINKYGNAVSSATLNISGLKEESTFFKSINKASDGDLLINGYNIYPGLKNFKAIILRVKPSGLVEWITNYASSKFEFKYLFKNAVHETKDGQVLTGTVAHFYDAITGSVKETGFHLISLDKNSGEKKWDQVLEYSGLQTAPLVALSSVSYITDLPGGELSFNTSFSDSTKYNQPDYNGKSVSIIVTSAGAFKKAISYYNTQPGSHTADGLKLNNNGDQLLLLDDGKNSLLVEVGKEAGFFKQKAFLNSASNLRAMSLSQTEANTTYIFMSNKVFGNRISLYKTDTTASIACVKAEINMI
ncbi:MAG: hypothetical protein ABIR81_01485, partial [Ginsengibacter sp.]